MNFLYSVYSSLSRYALIKYIFIQSFLLVVFFFNFLLNLTPFHVFKKIVCFAFGVHLGRNVAICKGVRFLSIGNCIIGDNSIINRDCILDNRGRLHIGANVSVASRAMIWTAGHDLNDEKFRVVKNGVFIGDQSVIFSGAMIMPGVKLWAGCVVYPGAVVAKSFPRNSIVGGVPAKLLGVRALNAKYNLNGTYWFN